MWFPSNDNNIKMYIALSLSIIFKIYTLHNVAQCECCYLISDDTDTFMHFARKITYDQIICHAITICARRLFH